MKQHHLAKYLEPGTRIGWLTVVGPDGNHRGKTCSLLKCDCGNTYVAQNSTLRRGQPLSCGCQRYNVVAEKVKRHGYTGSITHMTWISMRSRCKQASGKTYSAYGGRGISVCDRWQVFENFLTDMGERPSLAYSLDRINVNGNYEPGNCRWATDKEQSRNRTDTRYLTFEGRTMCLADWAEELGIKYVTLSQRVRKGWPMEKALYPERFWPSWSKRKKEPASIID